MRKFFFILAIVLILVSLVGIVFTLLKPQGINKPAYNPEEVSRNASKKNEIQSIIASVEGYKEINKRYPETLNQVTDSYKYPLIHKYLYQVSKDGQSATVQIDLEGEEKGVWCWKTLRRTILVPTSTECQP